jgi:hypothetical protein
MIHGQHRVKAALDGAEEHGVGGIGSIDVPSASRRFLDGGADDLDLLPAEIAAVAGVRIESGHGDFWRIDAGAPQAIKGEREFAEYRVL